MDTQEQALEIRRLAIGDFQPFYSLSLTIIQEIGSFYPKEVFGNYPAYFARYLTNAIRGERGKYVLGAFLRGKPAGLIVGAEKEELLYIEFLGVYYPKRGIGKKLLESFEGIARDRGLFRVYLLTSIKNVPAVTFYRKCGYSIDWVLRNYWHGWHYIQMSKQISTKDWGEIERLPDATTS